MSYLGKYETRTADFKVYTSSTATATHTLSWTPTSKQSLRITINGVVQQDDAFSLTGNTVTLDAAILVTDVLEIVGVNELGGQVLVPADGSIQAGKLASNAVTTAKIQDNAVTLDKMAGLARGKIIVGDASGDPSALTVGAANQVLKSDGTDVSWGTDTGGALEFISRTTVNSVVSDISINDAFSSTYDNYRMVFESLMVDTNGADIHWGFRASTSGTVDTMNFIVRTATAGGSSVIYNATSSAYAYLAPYVTHDGGLSGSVDIYRPFLSTATDWTMYAGLTIGYNTNEGAVSVNYIGVGTSNTASLPHIRIWASTGNIGDASSPGYIDLYGYKKS